LGSSFISPIKDRVVQKRGRKRGGRGGGEGGQRKRWEQKDDGGAGRWGRTDWLGVVWRGVEGSAGVGSGECVDADEKVINGS
jgi:hypothetical protein